MAAALTVEAELNVGCSFKALKQAMSLKCPRVSLFERVLAANMVVSNWYCHNLWQRPLLVGLTDCVCVLQPQAAVSGTGGLTTFHLSVYWVRPAVFRDGVSSWLAAPYCVTAVAWAGQASQHCVCNKEWVVTRSVLCVVVCRNLQQAVSVESDQWGTLSSAVESSLPPLPWQDRLSPGPSPMLQL